jgi:xanthine dehydrogenase accessory factor
MELAFEIFDGSRLTELKELAGAEAEGSFSTEGRMEAGRLVRRVLAVAKGGGDPAPGTVTWRDGVLTEGFGDPARPLILFGAGHVGRALVLAFAPLPFRVTWVDPRPDAFPALVPAGVSCVQPESPAEVLAAAPEGAFILVMTHSHGLDLEIVHAALAAARFPYVGLIGSATKRARFVSQLRAAGIAADSIAALVCPIGVGGIRSKLPAVIAAATAAELLQRDEELRLADRPSAETARRSRGEVA